uniref:Polydeoxyribonucleotide synthase [ATP] n=1 Tax=viral metagenome TaxID=1070528 RepID=A0A6M3LR32_9ZZZZ
MPEYQRWKNIMKCYPFEEKRLAKWQPPYIVQPKYDGVRCRAIPLETSADRGFMLLSSEENVIFSVPHLNIVLMNLGIRAELDGELYCHGLSFEEIVSITSRTVNIHPDHRRIQFHVFDIVNQEPQMKRQLIIENLRGLSPYIQVAPFWLCENLDDVMRAYDKLVELNYEGIIVRHAQAPYERKRSTSVMKFKPKKEDEYEIIGTQEEVSIDGRAKDSLGALVCRSGDGNLFSVGTGFSADQRKALWRDKESVTGKIARVKYQHLTSGKRVPRFPVFVEIVEVID